MVYSPFVCLPQAKLTPAGLLELEVDDGEVEVFTRDSGMRLYFFSPGL